MGKKENNKKKLFHGFSLVGEPELKYEFPLHDAIIENTHRCPWGNMNVEKTVIAGRVLADNADGADIADFILKLFYKSLAAR